MPLCTSSVGPSVGRMSHLPWRRGSVKRWPFQVAAAVVAGHPDVQAHVVAQLEQAPLDLGVGGRLPSRDKLFVRRLLGLVGGFLAVGDSYGPS